MGIRVTPVSIAACVHRKFNSYITRDYRRDLGAEHQPQYDADGTAVTVVGHAATIAAGEWITASGEWVSDRTHGNGFASSTGSSRFRLANGQS